MKQIESQKDNQNFYEMLEAGAFRDGNGVNKVLAGIIIAGYAVAILLISEGSYTGAMVMAGLVTLLLLILLGVKRNTKKSKAEGKIDNVWLNGAAMTDLELIQQLNEDYANQKVLFQRNEPHWRVFLFPDYLIYSQGSTINIIAMKQLYWLYPQVQRTNGVVTGHFVCLATENRMIALKVKEPADGEEIIRLIVTNHQIYSGYNEELQQLYMYNKEEFIRIMNEQRNR